MKFIINNRRKASFNIAMDEWLLTNLRETEAVFSLWQNENAVIVGKHQNTFEEINPDFIQANKIEVIRRITGGGAVYHDLGNLNFTFIIPIQNPDTINWKQYVSPIILALKKIGINAEINGRNDILLDGKKISGNAQRYANGYLMHHGTLLFDSKIETMVQALNVSEDKFISKAVKSVKSRVGNISEVAKEVTINTFKNALTYELSQQFKDSEICLTPAQIQEIETLEKEKFSTWEWNYGESPQFNFHAQQKFEGGLLSVKAQVEEGKILSVHFEGDFLGLHDLDEILTSFIGMYFKPYDIKELLELHRDKKYFGDITAAEVASLFH